MKYEAIALAIIGSLFTLIGVVIGSYLSHKSAKDLFEIEQRSNLRIRSYSRLMGIKLPIIQTNQTNLEAKMLCEFYETRFLSLSKNPEDFAEAKRQNERGLDLIPRISDLNRDLFETLGEIMIAYEMDDELSKQIDKLYHFQSANVELKNRDKIKSEADLEKWKEEANSQIKAYLNSEFRDPIESLLKTLKRKIEKTGT